MNPSPRIVYPLLYYLPAALVTLSIIGFAIHYAVFGPKIIEDDKKEEIQWWSKKERIIHLLLMVTFVVMVLTGLTMSLSPVKQGLGTIGVVRLIHRIGPAFGVATLLMLIIWVRFAIFKRYDFNWFRHLGGYLGFKEHLKAGKFNAGQKVWFWIALVFGATQGVTGGRINMMDPGPTRNVFITIHLISATILLSMFMVHLYMSIFVVKGSLRGMLTGKTSKLKAQKLHSEASVLKE